MYNLYKGSYKGFWALIITYPDFFFQGGGGGCLNSVKYDFDKGGGDGSRQSSVILIHKFYNLPPFNPPLDLYMRVKQFLFLPKITSISEIVCFNVQHVANAYKSSQLNDFVNEI